MRSRSRSSIAVAVLSVCWSFTTPVTAQESVVEDWGPWFMVFGMGPLGESEARAGRLWWWADVQPRFSERSDGYNQGLVRPGLGYSPTEEVTVWLGYAWINTDPSGTPAFDENRIWQQLLWLTRFEPFGFQSRTRLEQRFVETGSDMGWRLRQFLKVTYPFASAPQLGLSGYDELFLHLNDTDWGADAGFDQNRLFVGFFWKPDVEGPATIEVGYLNQFVAKSAASDEMNHILSVNLLLNY